MNELANVERLITTYYKSISYFGIGLQGIRNVAKMAIKCEECMQDAPYKWCCKTVCMEIEVCRNCEAKCKEVVNECQISNDAVGGSE